MIKISRYTLLYLWAVGSLSASAAIYYWDPAGNGSTSGGVGTWNTGSAIWADAPSGGADTAWVNGSDAVFGGTVTALLPTTVTLSAPITVGNLNITAAGYTIAPAAGAPLTLTNGITATAPIVAPATAPAGGTIINGPGGVILSGSATGSQTINVTNGLHIGAVLSGSDTLVKSGAGALGLGAANMFTGKFLVTEGLLVVNTDAALGAVPSSFQSDNITLNGGILAAGVNVTGPVNFGRVGTVTLNANRGITLGANGGTFRVGYGTDVLNVNGIVSGQGGLTKIDSGFLVLNGINTYTGKTTITGNGTLTVNGSIASTSSIEINNGTLLLGVSGTFGHLPITFSSATSYLKFSRTDDFTYSDELITNSGGFATIGSNAGQTVTVTSNIHGAGGFGSTGAGTVVLMVDTTGGTNVGGKLQVGNGGTAGNIGTGKITFFSSGENYLMINHSEDLVLPNAVTISGGRGHFSTTLGRTLTLTGAFTGSGELWINGQGTVVINTNAATSRTGNNVIESGVLEINSLTRGGNSPVGTGFIYLGQSTTTAAIGATLRYTGASVATDAFANVQSPYAAIDVTNANTVLSITSAFAVNNPVAGAPTNLLTKRGAGTLSYEGTGDNGRMRVQMEGGTLLLGKNTNASAHSLAGNDALILNQGLVQITGNNGDQVYDSSSLQINGGTFDLNGASEAFNILYSNSAGGVVTNNQAGPISTLTLGGNNGSGVYTGKLQDGAGQLALVKNGTGSLTLAGVSVLGGGTKVNNGRLIVAGSLTGGLTEVSGNTDTNGKYTGGILGGTGRVGDVITHKGFISPGATATGAGIGTLTTGTLDMSDGGTLEIAINTSTLESSLLQIEGDLSLGFSSAVLSLTDVGGGQPLTVGTTLTIMSYTGFWDGTTFLFGKLGSIEDETSFTFGLNTYKLDYDAASGTQGVTDVTLTVLSSVPEPATGGLFVGGLALLGSWRRRRKVVPGCPPGSSDSPSWRAGGGSRWSGPQGSGPVAQKSRSLAGK